jgi:hypothetical protein
MIPLGSRVASRRRRHASCVPPAAAVPVTTTVAAAVVATGRTGRTGRTRDTGAALRIEEEGPATVTAPTAWAHGSEVVVPVMEVEPDPVQARPLVPIPVAAAMPGELVTGTVRGTAVPSVHGCDGGRGGRPEARRRHPARPPRGLLRPLPAGPEDRSPVHRMNTRYAAVKRHSAHGRGSDPGLAETHPEDPGIPHGEPARGLSCPKSRRARHEPRAIHSPASPVRRATGGRATAASLIEAVDPARESAFAASDCRRRSNSSPEPLRPQEPRGPGGLWKAEPCSRRRCKPPYGW